MNNIPNRQKILPLGRGIKHFFLNTWHLRSFFLIIFLVLISTSFLFYQTEFSYFSKNKNLFESIRELFFISINYVLPANISSYIPCTDFGKCLAVINCFCGFLLLGLFLWIVQTSFKDQTLRKSKYIFF